MLRSSLLPAAKVMEPPRCPPCPRPRPLWAPGCPGLGLPSPWLQVQQGQEPYRCHITPVQGNARGAGCCGPMFVWQNRADLQAPCSEMPERAANPHTLSPVDETEGTSLPAQTDHCCSMFGNVPFLCNFFFKKHFNGLNPSGTWKSVIFLDYFV